MFTTLFQIAKNTFRESLREPIFLLVLLTSLVLIGLFPVFTMFVFNAQEKLVVDSCMATTMLFGWGLAILISSYAISREIDNGTALLLLSKPVRRPIFIIAKIAGILGANFVFCVLTSLASLISLRVAGDQFRIDMYVMGAYFGALALAMAAAAIYNYITRSSFPMAAILALLVTIPCCAVFAHFLPYEGERVGLSGELVPGLVLVVYSVLIMGCLATTLSTRFNLVSNLLICSALFLLGLMADYLVGRHTYEKWQDAPPSGAGALWMSSYTFAPTELADVGKWEVPVKVDDGEAFVVWSSKEKPRHLPNNLGTDAAASWSDTPDWKDNLKDVDGTPTRLGRYDADLQKWEVLMLVDEAQNISDSKEHIKGSFTSYVFRRSANRPRVPKGGNYRNPLPNSGSLVATFFYAAIPNWQLFWLADAIANHTDVPATYMVYGAAYVVILVSMLIILAVLLFDNREVGCQIIN